MPTNPLLELTQLGQSIWLDSIRRGHILSGELKQLFETDELRGETSNPTIFEKAIAGSRDYDGAIRDFIAEGNTALGIYETLSIQDVRMAADVFYPLYTATHGADGFVSLEVSPKLAYDTAGTIAEAQRLFARVHRPNVMIKIPATPQGLPAIEQCLYEGINVNTTLLFAVAVYEEVAWAYLRALERRAAEGTPLDRIAAVASFFVSRIDTAIDPRLEANARGKVAIANSKMAYRKFKMIFHSPCFLALKEKGARVQRLLWASTSTKNPQYRDVLYVESLIGPDTVNTLPLETIRAFRDHGRVRATLEEDVAGAARVLHQVMEAGIDLDAITRDLLADGVQKFAESFDKLLQSIETKQGAYRTELRAVAERGEPSELR